MSYDFFNAIIIYSVIFNWTFSKAAPIKNVCITDECEIAAKEIAESIDENIEPCDNFYKFVCGNYIKTKTATLTQLDLLDQMRTGTRMKLISFFENIQDYNITIKPFKQIAKLYNLCMDQRTLNEQGVEPLQRIMNQLGSHLVLESEKWDEKSIDWLTITSNGIKLGLPFDFFIKVSVTNESPVGSNRRIIKLNRLVHENNIGLQLINYVYNFYNSSVKNAMKLGIKRKNAEKELKETSDFLINLIKLNMHSKNRQRLITYHDLLTKWPDINWNVLITTITSMSSSIGTDKNDFVIVDDIYLDELIQFINKTSKKVLRNYVFSRIVDAFMIYVHSENITQSRLSRANLCLNIIADHMPNALDAMFAMNFINFDEHTEVNKITNAIKEEFIKIIKHTYWLNYESKEKAIEKLKSTPILLGYFNEWNSDDYWNDLFDDFNLDSDSFLHCLLKIIRFFKLYQYQTGSNHIEEGNRLIQMDEMPYYLLPENQITGFLVHVFSNNNLPKYVNYGRTGFFIGHETAHVFDYIDELFEIDRDSMESSLNKIHEETTCIINQYSNYSIEQINLRLNGQSSFRENIADNTGVRLAYLAYKNWIAHYGPDLKLPNLNYSSEQMFWINLAIPWCTNTHIDVLKRIAGEDHSPAEFRIIGSVSNSNDFARDFNCPKGSRMNPITKCSIWQ